MENNELQHHGILGMKWGVRRYQKKDGSLTPAGKKRRAQEEAEEKSYEERKQQALKSGSATDVMKFKGDLTKQEMDSAIARIRWEKDMSDFANKEASSKTNKLFDKIGKATEYAGTAAKGWNMIANVYNAFNKNGVILPKIDTNITNGNHDERNKKEKPIDPDIKRKLKAQADEAEAKARKAKYEADEKKPNDNPKPGGNGSDNPKPGGNDSDGPVTGTVFGEGKSKGSQQKKSKTKGSDTIYNVEYEDVTNKGKSYASNLPALSSATSVAPVGQSFVAGLLED